MCITFESRLEATQSYNPPHMVKGCRSFVGMVNFLSMFCPELQKLLKPIYDLIRKGRPFLWGKEQQDSFEEIKYRLIKPPVMHMPNKTGTFNLYPDTSNLQLAAHYTKYRMENLKLISYASKRLPEAMKKLLYNINRAMWFGHKYSKLLTFTQKS